MPTVKTGFPLTNSENGQFIFIIVAARLMAFILRETVTTMAFQKSLLAILFTSAAIAQVPDAPAPAPAPAPASAPVGQAPVGQTAPAGQQKSPFGQEVPVFDPGTEVL